MPVTAASNHYFKIPPICRLGKLKNSPTFAQILPRRKASLRAQESNNKSGNPEFEMPDFTFQPYPIPFLNQAL
jgi:hypothetical protein